MHSYIIVIAFISSVWLNTMLPAVFTQQTDTPAMIRNGVFTVVTALLTQTRHAPLPRGHAHVIGCSC